MSDKDDREEDKRGTKSYIEHLKGDTHRPRYFIEKGI